jgi:hypothetical protein
MIMTTAPPGWFDIDLFFHRGALKQMVLPLAFENAQYYIVAEDRKNIKEG